MDKLNNFIDKNDIKELNKEEIMNQSGIETICYVKNTDLYKWYQNKNEFIIGIFINCPFWLKENQLNYIRKQFQDSHKEISLILDKVSFF